jgi:outer membrane lipoprotein-sorting protein
MVMAGLDGKPFVEMSGDLKYADGGKRARLSMTTKTYGRVAERKIVSDGITVWTEHTADGKTNVEKQAVADGAVPEFNPIHVVGQMATMIAFTEVTEGTLRDVPVLILSGRFHEDVAVEALELIRDRDGEAAALQRATEIKEVASARLYIGKTDHLIRKFELLSKFGGLLAANEFKDVKLDPALGEADFTYTPVK